MQIKMQLERMAVLSGRLGNTEKCCCINAPIISKTLEFVIVAVQKSGPHFNILVVLFKIWLSASKLNILIVRRIVKSNIVFYNY